MKINETRPFLETSGELEEQFFSIQDTGMIFEILRNKMYSNPILAIAREISCNARDAHREVGTPDRPIEIHLPNTLEPEYRVKDFGPGISPDRMSNIFIKYTASTKRADNTQTGGFGLGAKTPFSYSDAFSIITIHNGTKYLYNCLIDATKAGKLMLAHEEPTDLPNSTEIIIPVKSKNFTEFATWTERACYFWEVKPIITGGTIQWGSINKIISGSRWAFTKDATNSFYDRHIAIIVDEIQYDLNLNILRKYADCSLIDQTYGNLVLWFGVGEITLSATREQIYLDEHTQKVLRDRLGQVSTELKKKISEKIESFDNYWDASIYYHQELKSICHNKQSLGTFSWRGLVLHENQSATNCVNYIFRKGVYSRKHGTDPNKLSRGYHNFLSFDKGSEIYINDLGIKVPTPRHVKKAFDNPNITSVQVICPSDTLTLEKMNKSFHLDKMNPKLLSTITKASGRTYTPATSRLLVFKFESRAAAFRQVSYSSLEEDINDKILCTLHKNYFPDSRQPVLGTKPIGLDLMAQLVTRFPNISIYGIDETVPASRIEEDFGDLPTLEQFLKDKLPGDDESFLRIKCCLKARDAAGYFSLKNIDEITQLVTDSNSMFLKRVNVQKEIKKFSKNSDAEYLALYEMVNGEISTAELSKFVAENPDLDFDSIEAAFNEKYPLLSIVRSYSYYYDLSTMHKAVSQYINLIDKESK